MCDDDEELSQMISEECDKLFKRIEENNTVLQDDEVDSKMPTIDQDVLDKPRNYYPNHVTKEIVLTCVVCEKPNSVWKVGSSFWFDNWTLRLCPGYRYNACSKKCQRTLTFYFALHLKTQPEKKFKRLKWVLHNNVGRSTVGSTEEYDYSKDKETLTKLCQTDMSSLKHEDVEELYQELSTLHEKYKKDL